MVEWVATHLPVNHHVSPDVNHHGEIWGGEGWGALWPSCLSDYTCEQKISPGQPGIPAELLPWSQANEKKLIESLISDLNQEFIAEIDPNLNLSRSAKGPAMYPAVRSGSIEAALIIGR
jgi:hypothetical protein